MIYAAQIDSSNVVLRVIVAPTVVWCVENLGGDWIECAMDGSIRGAYPGPGWTYDMAADTFVPPEPDSEL